MSRDASMVVLDTVEAARAYCQRGWAVVPIPCGEKAPRLKDWPKLRLANADLATKFSSGENIGIILGEASAGLVDVDLDAAEARCVAAKFLPDTRLVHGRATKPTSHFWFRTLQSLRPEKFTDVDGSALAELRSTGQQTVVPPSVHPSGERLEWERQGEPSTVEPGALRSAVAKIAAVAILARHWPTPGARNDAANALAGMLLRAGWDEEETIVIITAVAGAANDEELRQRARDVASTARRIASGRPATGTPTLATIVGEKVVERIRAWLGPELHRKAVADVSPLANEIRRIALTNETALFDKRRDIACLVESELRAEGQFFRTRVAVFSSTTPSGDFTTSSNRHFSAS